MAGVGKPIELQALATDPDIRTRFPEGMVYMSFGQEATVQSATLEIVKFMRLTRAKHSAQLAQASTSLKDAVDYAVL